MPSKQSRNVKVQSHPVSSSVSYEQIFYDRAALIVRQLNNAKESYGQYHTLSQKYPSSAEIITEFALCEPELTLIQSEFKICAISSHAMNDTVSTHIK